METMRTQLIITLIMIIALLLYILIDTRYALMLSISPYTDGDNVTASVECNNGNQNVKLDH